jgi:hypothetical protein
MNKLLLALLVLSPAALYAADSAEFVAEDNDKKIQVESEARTPISKPAEAEYVASVDPEQKVVTDFLDKTQFNPRASHWYTTFGFEGMEYDLPFKYVGEKERFNAQKRQLYGGRIGFGGEIHLGGGLMTSTRLEGYYMGTLFESAKTAAPELDDEDVALVKDEGQIFGMDAVQTLSYLWDIKTYNPFMDTHSYLTIEPFIEAGIGRASAWNKKDYFYNADTVEEYDQSFKDELTNIKFGAGVNFTSNKGMFLYLKATQNRYDITKRTTKGYQYANGQTQAAVDPNASTKLDAIMIYSLGGGYKF